MSSRLCETCQTNHSIAWGNSKIITTNRRYHQRRCLEAWHINSANAPLNRDDGGLLPDAYLHLIDRCHHLKSSIKENTLSAKITPDEDTRPECRNVGSWIVTSLRPRTHGNVFLRFCIVSSNELVVLDSLENSKQYENAGKRFLVYGA